MGTGTGRLTASEVSGELTAFLTAGARHQVGPDDDYFALGLVNSLFALELVTFVERRFGLEVGVEDLDLDHFRTVGRLTDFVLRKTAA
ncbi:acyl carrier protein [Streptomyces sp. MZ04]|uniref:acyl carrier protein n=1 Tax=Streptomyces sp. MZ04 TaxID=2559236 RepID=UPI00107E8639|nr:acyl carrier protein [Streptomyces sp. MZ04]TGA92970.1 acyl carrier protein [Streptomyces sp. MZ04]